MLRIFRPAAEDIVSANQPDSPTPGAEKPTAGLGARLGADWAAVIVAAVLVVLAVAGLLPSITFLVK